MVGFKTGDTGEGQENVMSATYCLNQPGQPLIPSVTYYRIIKNKKWLRMVIRR